MVVNVERANGVVKEGRFPTFNAVTGDSITYFKQFLRDLSRVYLWTIE